MDEKKLAKLLDAGFTALSVGFTREEVLAEVGKLEASGMTADQIADELPKMRRASSEAARQA